MFSDDSASAPTFNWIRGESGLIHSQTHAGEDRMKGKQVMRLSQNYLINFFYSSTEMSRISLAWSIMGGRESLCEGLCINLRKH